MSEERNWDRGQTSIWLIRQKARGDLGREGIVDIEQIK